MTRTKNEWLAYDALKAAHGVTTGDDLLRAVAEEAGVSKAAASKIVDQKVKDGAAVIDRKARHLRELPMVGKPIARNVVVAVEHVKIDPLPKPPARWADAVRSSQRSEFRRDGDWG